MRRKFKSIAAHAPPPPRSPNQSTAGDKSDRQVAEFILSYLIRPWQNSERPPTN
jgi:hypothetical protein